MLAQYYRDYGPMMDGWDHTSWVSAVFGLLFFLFLVIVVIYLLRALTGHHHTGHTTTREPLDIARERYAKGEITKDEFAEIKKELK
jgi:putative membrane protein